MLQQAVSLWPFVKQLIVLAIVTCRAGNHQIRRVIAPPTCNRHNVVNLIVRSNLLAAVITFPFLSFILSLNILNGMFATIPSHQSASLMSEYAVIVAIPEWISRFILLLKLFEQVFVSCIVGPLHCINEILVGSTTASTNSIDMFFSGGIPPSFVFSILSTLFWLSTVSRTARAAVRDQPIQFLVKEVRCGGEDFLTGFTPSIPFWYGVSLWKSTLCAWIGLGIAKSGTCSTPGLSAIIAMLGACKSFYRFMLLTNRTILLWSILVGIEIGISRFLNFAAFFACTSHPILTSRIRVEVFKRGRFQFLAFAASFETFRNRLLYLLPSTFAPTTFTGIGQAIRIVLIFVEEIGRRGKELSTLGALFKRGLLRYNGHSVASHKVMLTPRAGNDSAGATTLFFLNYSIKRLCKQVYTPFPATISVEMRCL